MTSNLLLLITAALWGFAFVAQSKGSQSMDAFSFNAIRFALGAIFIRIALHKSFKKQSKLLWQPGLVLFIAASLQQIGIIFTTAGSAGFITGLYVLFVPLFGLFRKQIPGSRLVIAIALALPGMYLINSTGGLRASFGNLLVLVSALFWAIHVQLVDKYSKLHSTGQLAFGQFAICALLSALSALIWRFSTSSTEVFSAAYFSGIAKAWLPILYGGLISVGIAYTLQIKAQQKAEPAAAAIIMCLEGVFALLGSYLLLSEAVGLRSIFGALLMLFAMILASLPKKLVDRNRGSDLSAQTLS
jgi:drug/metabolite transporter (DMT)-like permease